MRSLARSSVTPAAGVTAFRSALDDWVIDGKPVDSVLEPTMQQLLTCHRLPPAQFHARIGRYEVDFWFPDTPIVLECDGWEHHGRERRTFESDRVRNAELTGLGFITVRFTYRQLTRQPAATAKRIRDALARWAPHLELAKVRRDR